jgi:hypothetical protein
VVKEFHNACRIEKSPLSESFIEATRVAFLEQPPPRGVVVR